MMNVVKLSVSMLNVVILSVIMLNAVVPNTLTVDIFSLDILLLLLLCCSKQGVNLKPESVSSSRAPVVLCRSKQNKRIFLLLKNNIDTNLSQLEKLQKRKQ
jgi:hypothetical protein